MDEKLYRKILTHVPMFEQLTPDELESIVAISRLIKVKSGTTIVREGEDGAAMYVLVEGKVRVYKKLANGELAPLADLNSPSVFGEMALIDRSPRSASVGTITDTILYQIDLKSFNRLRATYSPAAYKILRAIAPTICGRLRDINDRIGRFFEDPENQAHELRLQYKGTSQLGQ